MHGNGNLFRCKDCGSKMSKDGDEIHCLGTRRKGDKKGKSCGNSVGWMWIGKLQ